MTKAQSKKAINKALAENFTVGAVFKANELAPYLDMPTRTIGRYLAQMNNIRITATERRIRIYELVA